MIHPLQQEVSFSSTRRFILFNLWICSSNHCDKYVLVRCEWNTRHRSTCLEWWQSIAPNLIYTRHLGKCFKWLISKCKLLISFELPCLFFTFPPSDSQTNLFSNPTNSPNTSARWGEHLGKAVQPSAEFLHPHIWRKGQTGRTSEYYSSHPRRKESMHVISQPWDRLLEKSLVPPDSVQGSNKIQACLPRAIPSPRFTWGPPPHSTPHVSVVCKESW